MKYFCSLILLFFAVNFLSAQTSYKSQTTVNSVLATVNGEPITLLDVILESGARERELAGVYSGDRLIQETSRLRREVLNNIIFHKLVYREYQNQPFDIPIQHVEAMLDEHARNLGGISRAELEKKLNSYGSNLAELRKKARERIAVDVILFRDCDSKVVVTPKEVYDEYSANVEKFTSSRQVDFQILQLNLENGRSGMSAAEAAKKIGGTIKNADATLFTRLVSEYSDNPNREKGGMIVGEELPKLRPEFQKALKDRKIGDVIGPVATPEALFFLRVTALKEAKIVPFENVSQTLYQELRKREATKKRREYEKKLREKALIRTYI